MMKKLIMAMTVIACSLGGTVSQAAVIGLADYGFNVDGVFTSAAAPGNVSIAGFSTATGLGTVTATFSGAGSHYFGMYVDHEIDELINTYFNELGLDVGAPAAGQTWEVDEPGFVLGDIFANVSSFTLDLDNMVGFPSTTFPDDVAMALAWDFLLAAGETATISMRVATAPPASGFYLEQFDPHSDASIYFSSALTIIPDGGGVIPEPSSWIVMLGLAGVSMVGFRRAQRNRSKL